jgi:putative transposase
MRFVRDPSEAENEELERMTQQEVGRVAIRAHMILLSAEGYTVPEIVEIHDTTNVTVYKWFDRFDAQGPEGLYDQARSGRPSKVDEEVEQEVEEAMSEPPTERGYNCTIWTTALLQAHIEDALDVTVCDDTVRRTLHKLDYRWRRPRWAVEREDPRSTEIMASIARAIWNAEPGSVCLLEDETKFRTLPPLRRMWMKKGQQVHVPTPEQNEKFYSYGALDFESGNWIDSLFDQANSDATISYLEDILAAYPERPILLIWDQAGYHTSKRVQRWIDQQPRLTVLFLPKYAPELNPVEQIWRVVKQRVAANLTRTVDAIKTAYHTFFKQESSQDLLQTASLAI